MPFWVELKRRNVFKVSAAYAVAAWLIAQIVSVIDAPLNLPEWFATAVIVLLAVGFPIALLLAWAYEVTPEGIKATKKVPIADSVTQATGQRLNYVVTGLLVLAVGFMAIDNYMIDRSVPSADASSDQSVPAVGGQATPIVPVVPLEVRNKVAVLPCDNLSPNAADAYFAAGIHEEILNQLAKISSLLVVARTSVLQYAERKPTIPEIARELSATAIMECSVRYAGDDILVTAQLIDPETDSHIWSETYPGNLSDLSAVFAMQADIAMNIANALQAEFSPAEQARLENVPTDSREAYSLFLGAVAAGPTQQRMNLLDQAVTIDPQFAAAYALIASELAWTTLNTNVASATTSWSEVGARAVENAERALALDPNLPLAHAARALIDELSWRWADALAGYTRAYELNPSNPEVLGRLSFISAFAGADADAIRFGQQLVELRPNEAVAFTNFSAMLGHTGNIDAAISACERALILDPVNLFCQHGIGLMYARLGDVSAAETQFRLVERLMGSNRLLALLPQLAVGYSQIGRTEDVARLASEIELAARETDIGAGGWAGLYLSTGDRTQVKEWLEIAIAKVERNEPDAGYYELMSIKTNIYGLAMLEEPEFQALRSRLGPL